MDFAAIHALLRRRVPPGHNVTWPAAEDGWPDWEAPIPCTGYAATAFAKRQRPGVYEPYPPAECCANATTDPKGRCGPNGTTVVGWPLRDLDSNETVCSGTKAACKRDKLVDRHRAAAAKKKKKQTGG